MEPRDKDPPAGAGDEVFDWGDLLSDDADPRPSDASGEQASPTPPDGTVSAYAHTGVFTLSEQGRALVERYDAKEGSPPGTRAAVEDPFEGAETREMPAVTREQLIAGESALARATLSPAEHAPETGPTGLGTVGRKPDGDTPHIDTFPPRASARPQDVQTLNDPWNTATPLWNPTPEVLAAERAASKAPSRFPPPRRPPEAEPVSIPVKPPPEAPPPPSLETIPPRRRFEALRLLLALSLLWLWQQPRKRLVIGGLTLLASLVTIVVIIVQLSLDWWYGPF